MAMPMVMPNGIRIGVRVDMPIVYQSVGII